MNEAKLQILFCLSLAACGGTVIVDEGPSDTATTSATTTASSTSTAVGGAGGSTASGGSGGTAGCVPEVTVTTVSHSQLTLVPGSAENEILTIDTAVSDCSDVEVDSLSVLLTTPDADPGASYPFCADPCEGASDWDFRNLMVMEAVTDVPLMGPVEMHPAAQDQPARVDFTDAYAFHAGDVKTFHLVMDVADPLKTPITGMRYHASLLGAGATSPETIFTFVHEEDPDAFVTVYDPLAPVVSLTVTSVPIGGHVIAPDSTQIVMSCYHYYVHNGDAYLHSVTFKRVGAGDPSDIAAVRITGDALPLEDSPVKTLDPAAETVTFDIGYTVPPSTMGGFCAVVDFDASSPGGQHALELESVESIDAMGGIVIGEFPLVGPTWTIGNP